MHGENRCTLKRGGREGRNISHLTLTHDRPEGRPLSQGTAGLKQPHSNASTKVRLFKVAHFLRLLRTIEVLENSMCTRFLVQHSP